MRNVGRLAFAIETIQPTMQKPDFLENYLPSLQGRPMVM
jgi:hypothetical protein